jgi:sec-independent protein translocase protein TatC
MLPSFSLAAFVLGCAGFLFEVLFSVEKFVGFCLVFVFGFGIRFALPLAMILLGRIGAVPRAAFARNRRYAILFITIVSAVITPTPDAFNLAMMALPLYLLFEVGLLGMRLYGPAVKKTPAPDGHVQG